MRLCCCQVFSVSRKKTAFTNDYEIHEEQVHCLSCFTLHAQCPAEWAWPRVSVQDSFAETKDE